MEQKNCPACAKEMRRIAMTSTYGSPVFVDQCDDCGGLWFDDLEMYRVKIGDADQLDGLDKDKLQSKSVFSEKNLKCPNDAALLTRFEEPNFPADLHMHNCQKCGGFWLNRGEFAEFQEYRADVISKNTPKAPIVSEEDKKFNDQIQQLLAANTDRGLSDSMSNFSKFLVTPINPMTNRPFASSSLQASGSANTAIDIAFGILNIILRLFLR